MLVQTFRAKLTRHLLTYHITKPDPVCLVFSDCCFVMSLLFCWSVLANLFQGRVILSNKMARTVAFFYTLMLHCLVFLVSHMILGLHRPALLMLHCCFMCVCVIRCCIKPPGVRVSVGTVLHFVQRSEYFYPLPVSWMTFDRSFWFWTTACSHELCLKG